MYETIVEKTDATTRDGKILLIDTTVYNDHLAKLRAQTRLDNEADAHAHKTSAFYSFKKYKQVHGGFINMGYISQEDHSHEEFEMMEEKYRRLMDHRITSTDDGSKSLALQHTKDVFDELICEPCTLVTFKTMDGTPEKMLADAKLTLGNYKTLVERRNSTTDAHERVFINSEIKKELENSEIYEEHLRVFRYTMMLDSEEYIRNVSIATLYAVKESRYSVHDELNPALHSVKECVDAISFYEQYVHVAKVQRISGSISTRITKVYERYMTELIKYTDPGNKALALEHAYNTFNGIVEVIPESIKIIEVVEDIKIVADVIDLEIMKLTTEETDIYNEHLYQLRHETRLKSEMNAQFYYVFAFYDLKEGYKSLFMYWNELDNNHYESFMEIMTELTHDGNKSLALYHTRNVFDTLNYEMKILRNFTPKQQGQLFMDAKITLENYKTLVEQMKSATDNHGKLLINTEITKELESSTIYAAHLKEFRILTRLESQTNGEAYMAACCHKQQKVLSFSQHYMDLTKDENLLLEINTKYEKYIHELIELTDNGNKSLALQHVKFKGMNLS